MEVKKMKSEALKTSTGANLGCLFLMMANIRYKPVKKFLHEAFCAKKQQHPHGVLAVKRFMADFIGTDTLDSRLGWETLPFWGEPLLWRARQLPPSGERALFN